jgi:hypothetical protein
LLFSNSFGQVLDCSILQYRYLGWLLFQLRGDQALEEHQYLIYKLITRIASRISRESISPTVVDIYSAYTATVIVKASFEQICCLLSRVSKDQRIAIALYGVLSEHAGIILRAVNWDIDGSPIPNPYHTVYVLSGSSSSKPNITNDNNIIRTQ